MLLSGKLYDSTFITDFLNYYVLDNFPNLEALSSKLNIFLKIQKMIDILSLSCANYNHLLINGHR